jgi:hypothetical protein
MTLRFLATIRRSIVARVETELLLKEVPCNSSTELLRCHPSSENKRSRLNSARLMSKRHRTIVPDRRTDGRAKLRREHARKG